MKKGFRLILLVGFLGAALAAGPLALTLITPIGGENWVIGTEHGIVWTTIKGHPGTAYIDLWGYNTANQLINLGQIAAADYQKGSFLWKAGTLEERKVAPGRYHIRITVLCPSLPKMNAGNAAPFHLTAFPRPKLLKRN
jgi:hypothetical protein